MTPPVDASSVPCPGCGQVAWHPWRAAGDWRYLRCGLCRLARIDPMPTADDLGAVFDDGYFTGGGARGGYPDYDADRRTHLANAGHRLDRVRRLDGRDHRAPRVGDDAPLLVDVGCASGYTLDVAVRRGWRAVGVEVSPDAAARARSKGHRVVATLDELTGPTSGSSSGSSSGSLIGAVDVVGFFQVLEHLPDPLAALTTARALLRPDGVVICETWDGDSLIARLSGDRWQQLSPPSVLWVLDRPSARAVTARAGLQLIDWRPSSKLVSVGLVAGQLGAGPLAGAARRVVRRAGGSRVRYGLGDLVTFVASPG